MAQSIPCVTRQYQLKHGYRVTFTVDAVNRGVMDVEWNPNIPPKKLLKSMTTPYLKARAMFVAALEEATGLKCAVFDLNEDGTVSPGQL